MHTHMAMSKSMSTQAKGLLLFLAVVSYASGARGYITWISNGASRGIVALGSSTFVNSVIAPGTSQQYEYVAGSIHVKLWVEGAGKHNQVNIPADRSLVGLDHGAGSTGIDIYLAKYGTLFQKEGNVLVTIFLE